MTGENDAAIKEEAAYRRGYCHGFLAARRNLTLTEEEVYRWRHLGEDTAPPGSTFEHAFDCLLKTINLKK